jgi:hypothetical protein
MSRIFRKTKGNLLDLLFILDCQFVVDNLLFFRFKSKSSSRGAKTRPTRFKGKLKKEK